jgi:hypothetical protein
LHGRRSRQIWRELQPVVAAAGRFNAATARLLAVLCTLLADAMRRAHDITALMSVRFGG